VEIIHDKFKVHSLTGRITMELMKKAFKAVKKNQGAAGIDKVSIQDFEKNLEENLSELMRVLKDRTYQPIPLKRVYIPKGPGKKELRPLGIPTVRCRVAQEIVRRLINNTFEKTFHQNSFGFRLGRNCHQAVECVIDYIRQGYKFIVDMDIKGFFDNIPHDLIMNTIEAKIADGNILSLIRKFLQSGVMEEGELRPTTRGAPQGGLISPLIGNLILNHLDSHLDQLGYHFVRYADDCVILCKSKDQAEKALASAQMFLEGMELQLNPEKTHITHASQGFDFLGFHITTKSIIMREKSVEKVKAKIREETRRSNNLNQKVLEKLNQILRGVINYFATSFSSARTQIRQLESWTRKRIRCMKYKRIWRTDNWRIKNKHLEKMGFINCNKMLNKRLSC
jgi:RNA-directed DNA polymerase